jgi:hypothetical protein
MKTVALRPKFCYNPMRVGGVCLIDLRIGGEIIGDGPFARSPTRRAPG